MAMTMTGEILLQAEREVVWENLINPEVLKGCIPGCEEFNVIGKNEFEAVAVNKIGPIRAKFKGQVRLIDLYPAVSCRISGQGDGGIAGFAKGGAVVTLSDGEGGRTLLQYEVQAQIGGKLAQLGQRLINGAAKKMADEFFARFSDAVINPIGG